MALRPTKQRKETNISLKRDVPKKAPATSKLMTPDDKDYQIEGLRKELEKLKHSAYCYMCDTFKDKSEFYTSTDPKIKGGVTPICKDCAKKIALRLDKYGNLHEPTKESCYEALRYLDKPFINSVWDNSVAETKKYSVNRIISSAWAAYMNTIALPFYRGMTFRDSEQLEPTMSEPKDVDEESLIEEHVGMDTYDSFQKNKSDVIRLLDYDPFEKEPIEDQPFLYSQLLGLLDTSEDMDSDMMRVSSAIQIVRGFLQQSKIDDTIARLMADSAQIANNSSVIKSLQDSKTKLTGIITSLAAESCLSLKNSRHSKKGENTFTGKLRKIKELNLPESQVNGFDIATSKGMQQVAEISDASIMKQLRLDDSEWSDMVADMREDLKNIRMERDQYKEMNRILLRENIDIKDYLSENNIDISKDLVDLKGMYSEFAEKDWGAKEDATAI